MEPSPALVISKEDHRVFVILEGVDRTGKSTLADRLKQAWGEPHETEVHHHSAPSDHPLVEYVGKYADYDPRGPNIVCDRHYLGELVWPEIFERDTAFDAPLVRVVEEFLQARGAVLVLCIREEQKLLRELDEVDEPISGETARRAMAIFRREFEAAPLIKGVYDFERDGDLDAITELARAGEAVARK